MHSQLATEQPLGLAAMNWSKRPPVPPLAWSSPVMTTAAFLPLGRYQNLGNGLESISWIRLASRRCCSSACGMAILFGSTQSACRSPAAAP